MEGLGIELNGSLQEQAVWALSFTLLLSSQKGALKLFRVKTVSFFCFLKRPGGKFERCFAVSSKTRGVHQLITAKTQNMFVWFFLYVQNFLSFLLPPQGYDIKINLLAYT